jgi:carbon starvation protein
MIAAATLPVGDYYGMNTDLAKVPAFHDKFVQIGANVDHLPVYEALTQESLRGRTGGAVTLAVGFAHIFDGIPRKLGLAGEESLRAMWKYWYHFAIMFEALFILTTIDTGTRIGRFLLQEVGGKMIHPKLGQTDWWPGAIVSTALVVLGWAYFINAKEFSAIWPMFGIANQMLAVIALAVVSAYLYNEGRARYLWVTLAPMVVVMSTTGTAAVQMLNGQVATLLTQWSKADPDWKLIRDSLITGSLIVAMLTCTAIVIISGAAKVLRIGSGVSRREPVGFPVS